LLGLPVSDRDWVVVGSTPERMQELGYQPVGKDFPVFLHPQTREEYALARTEKKVAVGYRGFQFNADSNITLTQDLHRRDLTINAIAQSPTGALIDPTGGVADLENKILRHVSDAFVEDPLRVLRVARFSAQLAHLGFSVAPETLQLMEQIGQSGELASLAPERVFAELRRALQTRAPRRFFETLRRSRVLPYLLPEVDALFGVPQPAEHHPEIDSGMHTLMVLEQASGQTEDDVVRFASLCHDLGKATTPAELLPAHHGHEKRGAELAKHLCQRLKTPRQFADLAVLSARFHTHCHRAFELRPRSLLNLLTAFDARRRPERLDQFTLVCEADSRGRLGFENRAYPQAAYVRQAGRVLQQMDYAAIAREVALQNQSTDNSDNKRSVADAIRRQQLQCLSDFKKSHADS
jgi:tRNA nucleotidyltransferase (CCA-adding enzyme)